MQAVPAEPLIFQKAGYLPSLLGASTCQSALIFHAGSHWENAVEIILKPK